MSSVKNAVIAAAGLGSRLGLGMPKCMISVNKRPIIARMIQALSVHVETIVVVTGYREELIIEYCQNHFRDVVIARNPNYATTNTAQSLAIGAKFIHGKTIFLDGDLLIEEESLARFLRLSSDADLTLGVTRAGTDNPVYADCIQDSENYLRINRFSREQPTPYEWANLFVGAEDIMNDSKGYVFEKLVEHLPARAVMLDVAEIDTPQDMIRAEEAVQAWENER